MEMSKIENSLTHLEARLRAMIEGEKGSAGIPRKLHNQLVRALVQAMQAGVKREPGDAALDGTSAIAPDQYTLILPPAQAQILLTQPIELDRLAKKLESSAAQAKLHFAAPPMLRVVPDPAAQELNILVEYGHVELGDFLTTKLDGVPVQSVSMDGTLPQAFLIVNGLSTYPLSQPLINIGCDPANHLVLDDLSVSSRHAQLRFITDHFVLFDLDSKGGTFVNGVAISSRVLNPGDVIRLAGVPLVYGQETSPQLGYTQKLPVEPPAPEVL